MFRSGTLTAFDLTRPANAFAFAILLLVCIATIGAETNNVPTSERLFRNATGEMVDPFPEAKAVTVLVFVRPDCPISNRYVPELKRLAGRFANRKVVWWLVYPDKDVGLEAIRQHRKEYNLELPALHDPEHRLVRLTNARVTPEAAVFDSGRKLVYHGRIDDRFVAFGTARPEATHHDLETVLEDVLAGKAVRIASTKVIGCTIDSQP